MPAGDASPSRLKVRRLDDAAGVDAAGDDAPDCEGVGTAIRPVAIDAVLPAAIAEDAAANGRRNDADALELRNAQIREANAAFEAEAEAVAREEQIREAVDFVRIQEFTDSCSGAGCSSQGLNDAHGADSGGQGGRKLTAEQRAVVDCVREELPPKGGIIRVTSGAGTGKVRCLHRHLCPKAKQLLSGV